MFKIVKVRGMSMHPTLAPGDYLILTKARSQSLLRAGFVVLVDHAKYGMIIKRVKSVSGKSLRLEGDGPDSTSSTDMGDIAISAIKARARFAVTPKGVKRL